MANDLLLILQHDNLLLSIKTNTLGS